MFEYYDSTEGFDEDLALSHVKVGVVVQYVTDDHAGIGGPACGVQCEWPQLMSGGSGAGGPLSELDARVVEQTEFVIYKLRTLIKALEAQERRLIVERRRLRRDGVPRAEECEVEIPPQREIVYCNRCGGDSRVCDCPKCADVAEAVAEAVREAEAIWSADLVDEAAIPERLVGDEADAE